MLKKLILLAASLLFVRGVEASLYMEDAITNAASGSNLGSAAPWGASSSQVKVASGNLTLTGLAAPAIAGNLVNIVSTGGGSSYRPFNATALTSGTVYYSCLLRCTAVPTTSSVYLTGFLPSGTTSPGGSSDPLALYAQASGANFQLGIRKTGLSFSFATPLLTVNTTYLVVVKYAFGAGVGDDVVSLYISPTPGGTEPASPDASLSGGTDAANLQNVYFKSSSGYGGWNFDTLRVGSTWADVTPSSSGPPTVSQPYITQVIMDANGLILRGTNGSPNTSYQVIRSTTISLPRTNWTSIATNNFDTNGTFSATNPISSPNTAAFYSLLVAGQVFPPGTSPTITNQPQDQIVSVGDTASLTVGATGTTPLYFQWFFNTNTPLPLGTNATLSLPNAQTNDTGTYSVLVSNTAGSVLSAPALLTVNPIPTAPSIIASPTNLTVTAGQIATFVVQASGTDPLTYEWFFNTNTLVAGAASESLEIDNAQSNHIGTYQVIVSNYLGSATSAVATLTVVPAGPSITSQPASQSIAVGQSATFTVSAAGSAPLSYQWYFNTNTPVPGGTASSLTITNAQTNDSGTYSVIVTNSLNSATSSVATLAVSTSLPLSAYNLMGFGQATTGGGLIAETNAGYVKVYNAVDLSVALSDKKGIVKVIEIMNDLNLGYNEIPGDAKTNSEPFRAHNAPKLHPVLLNTGVSLIDIQGKSGLTIFSTNGATIRHATLNFKSSGNIIVRNLKFDELWEWDEDSKGDYDGNDWDFIDLGNSGTVSNIWIDHCTFTKSYDGIVDIKSGSYNITFSWCKYMGDDGATNTNSWVRQQINALEANRSSYAMYNFLRNNGFSAEDIITIIQGHDKTHLIGATTGSINAQHSVTFHHDWFINPWDRLPRLRGGNIHNFNIYVDDTVALAARRLRDAREAAMSTTSSNQLNNTYSFKPFLNGTISTEGGAILVEKSVYIDCLTPLRNNQTDPNDPTYAGKIMALDTIYQMDSTVIRGNSTDPGNPLGPFQATIIPFSWNLPGNQLPYSYVMDDPTQVQSVVTNPNFGAGSGILTWAKTNWLKTSY